MTDNDIIKALECFAAHYNIDNAPCDKCVFAKKEKKLCTAMMSVDVARITLDLINRQKAEIERLQSMNQAKLDMIHDIRAELETARAETITKFEDELKAHLCSYDLDNYHSFEAVEEDVIEQIAKKLKEGIKK